MANKYKSFSEGTLLKYLQQGDEKAFTELYNRYWEWVFTIALAKVGDFNDAEEIVQNIFFELWKRRQKLSVQGNLKCYLAGAVKYKVYTHFANKQKQALKMREIAIVTTSNATEDWINYESLRADLERSILELPEKCRLVYRLNREAGLSGRQISNQLNISQKTVENHMSKALGHLRSALKKFIF
ncbi:MAG: RNA polymerase sigma factor [Arachidicoccus sp.]